MDMPTIETERLLLRPLCEDDAEEISRIYSEPDVTEFIQEHSISPQEARQKICAHVEEHWKKFDYGMFATFSRESRKLVGRCGFLHQELEGEELCEVAYLIAREYWGRGFATEAVRALIRYGFEVLEMDLLVSLINRKNTRSIRVAEKTGMTLMKEYSFMYKYGVSGNTEPAGRRDTG